MPGWDAGYAAFIAGHYAKRAFKAVKRQARKEFITKPKGKKKFRKRAINYKRKYASFKELRQTGGGFWAGFR